MVKKKKSTSKNKKNRFVTFFKSKQTHLVFGVFLVLFAIFLFVSFSSFFMHWQADQDKLPLFADRLVDAKNLLGKIGAQFSHFFIYQGFGISAFIISILLFFTGFFLLFNLPFKPLRKAWFWGVVFMIWLTLAIGFFVPKYPLFSGVIGFEMNDFLSDFIGRVGVFLVLLFTLLSYVISRFKITPESLRAALPKRKERKSHQVGIDDATDEGYISETVHEKPSSELNVLVNNSDELPYEKEEIVLNTPEVDQVKHDKVQIEVEKTFEEDHLVENLSNKLVEDFGEFDPTLELSEFKFPSLDLLNDYGDESITINKEELEANKDRIVDTLSNYKIGIASIKATIGPTVTLYEIVPDAGVRISKIKNLEDDIALSLAALGIRIIAPIPGKGTIGIEVSE